MAHGEVETRVACARARGGGGATDTHPACAASRTAQQHGYAPHAALTPSARRVIQRILVPAIAAIAELRVATAVVEAVGWGLGSGWRAPAGGGLEAAACMPGGERAQAAWGASGRAGPGSMGWWALHKGRQEDSREEAQAARWDSHALHAQGMGSAAQHAPAWPSPLPRRRKLPGSWRASAADAASDAAAAASRTACGPRRLVVRASRQALGGWASWPLHPQSTHGPVEDHTRALRSRDPGLWGGGRRRAACGPACLYPPRRARAPAGRASAVQPAAGGCRQGFRWRWQQQRAARSPGMVLLVRLVAAVAPGLGPGLVADDAPAGRVPPPPGRQISTASCAWW